MTLKENTIWHCESIDREMKDIKYTWLEDKNWLKIHKWDKLKFYNWYYDDITEVVRYKTWWRWLEWCETFLHELFVRKDENNKELWKYLDVEVVF